MSDSPRHTPRLAALLVAAAAVSLPCVAAAEDLFVLPAALDQPRISIAFAPVADPTNPFTGEGANGGESMQIRAFWDTGASGVVLSPLYADAISMSLYQFNGQDVIFSDVGAGGAVLFNVSEQVVMRTAPSLGWFDGNPEHPDYLVFGDPANFTTLYDAVGPVPSRLQIGPIGSEGDLNVVGMPTMVGRKNVFDPRPVDNIIKFFDGDPTNDDEAFDSMFRAYSYDASHPLGSIPPGSSDPLINPGIPTADVSVSLSYADFSQYTDVTPTGAEAPTHSHNPFLGPNPLLGPQPGDGAAPIMRRGNLSMEASWLLDTGAAASFISQVKAAELNVVYSSDPEHSLGSGDPQLVDSVTGELIPNQFRLGIMGISGETVILAGFWADSLTIPTDQGDPEDPDDPNHLHFVPGEDSLGAPVLVLDIVLQNDDPEDTFILDGIFGMNFLTTTGAGDFINDPFPEFFALTPFDGIVFDEPAGKLYLSFADGQGWPVPEPGAAVLGLGFISLLLARRRSH